MQDQTGNQRGRKREKIKNLVKGVASFITSNTLKPITHVITHAHDSEYDSQQDDNQQSNIIDFDAYFKDETAQNELNAMIKKTCEKIEEAKKKESKGHRTKESMSKYYYDLRKSKYWYD